MGPEGLRPSEEEPKDWSDEEASERIKRYDSWEEIPSDPKIEGLRVGKRYVGGDPDEIIEIDGVRYRKKSLDVCVGKENIKRPYTEREYYSHFTDGVGPGPGWDSQVRYIGELDRLGGWGLKFSQMDPSCLANLPLYDLVPVDEKENE